MRPIKSIRFRQLLLVFVLALVGVEFVRARVGALSVVDGVSMYPTFHPNDVVLARTAYLGPQRGDVVIVAVERSEPMIKRVIGLPGETVTIYRGFIYINHQRLNEPYLPRYTYTFKSNEQDERADIWYLADNEYFVLGDNRSQSADSRYYGPVARRQIQGIVETPANALQPGFGEIMLSKTGQVVPGIYRNQVQNRPSRLAGKM